MIAGATKAVSHELFLGVARHRLVQVAFVAAHRHTNLHPRSAHQRQPLLVGFEVLGLDWHQHLLWHAERRLVAVQLLEYSIDQPAGADVFDLVDHESLATDDASLANVEDLHSGLEVVVSEADDVDVFAALGNHLLLLDRPAHRNQPVTHTRGALVLHRRGRRLHLGIEPLDDRVGVTFEEVAQLADQLPICDLADLTHARAAALLDVEQQTRPPKPLMFVELAGAAGANREAAQQEVERVADRVCVGVRSEVLGALALATTHHQRPRVLLVERDRQERVALVVAETNVEPRPVLLDEAVLEHQRLDLVADLDPLDRLGRRDHLRGPRVHVAWILEVVGKALPKAGRFTDVDHTAEGVVELVRPRRVGNRAGWRALHHQL